MKRSIANGQDAGIFFGTQFEPFCDRYKDLTPRQREICRNDMLLMGNVVEGASLAAKECKQQFKNERWNCSSISRKSDALGLMTKSRKYEPRTQDILFALLGKLARCSGWDTTLQSYYQSYQLVP